MTDTPAIIAIIGKRGEGKTMLLSLLNWCDWLHEKHIWTNYHFLDGKERSHHMTKDFLQTFFDTQGEAFLQTHGGVLAIDEIATFIDAYDFRSKKAKIFSMFVMQTRKRNVKLLYTTQQLRLVPIRIRDNTDYIYEPSYEKETDMLYVDVFSFDGKFKTYIRTWKIMKALFLCQKHGLYNTNELIEVLD